jgi:hypothetical protein
MFLVGWPTRLYGPLACQLRYVANATDKRNGSMIMEQLSTDLIKKETSGRINPPDGLDRIKKILYCVGLYQIADKYNFPGREKTASSDFKIELRVWLFLYGDGEASGHGDEQIGFQNFCTVVEWVYELPNTHPAHSLVSLLLEYTTPAVPFGSKGMPRLKKERSPRSRRNRRVR